GQAHRGLRPQHLLQQLPRGGGRQHLHRAAEHHGHHRAVRLRQVDVPAHAQPDARGHPRGPGRGQGRHGRPGPVRRGRRPGRRPPPDRHGLPAAQPVPDDVDLRQRRRGHPAEQHEDEEVRPRRPRGALAQGGQPLERGQGPPRPPGGGPVRRAAAAPVHRPRDRHRARRAAHGRARVGPGPDLHAGDRGSDARAQGALHHRHRHPQHAAGRAGERVDRLLQPQRHRAARAADRVQLDREDLRQPRREGDRGLHLRPLRL
ncbi:MAG: Phosphate transport ATP-binding protein PstB, partial [uncultured Blastococcus sp.]